MVAREGGEGRGGEGEENNSRTYWVLAESYLASHHFDKIYNKYNRY